MYSRSSEWFFSRQSSPLLPFLPAIVQRRFRFLAVLILENSGLPKGYARGIGAEPGRYPWSEPLGRSGAGSTKTARWQIFSKANTDGGSSGRHHHGIDARPRPRSLARPLAAGLARSTRTAAGQNYNKANTIGGLPDDRVEPLALGPDAHSGLEPLAVWHGLQRRPLRPTATRIPTAVLP